MSDIYVDGSVSRISPDAPVPVLLRSSIGRRASGACLAAHAAAEHGGRVALIGVVGDDEPGSKLTKQIDRGRVDSILGVVPGCATITKTRFRVGEHHLLRVDEDGTFAERADEVSKHVLAAWARVRADAAAVLISDYDKGTLGEAAIRQVLEEATMAGTRVVVDSKRRALTCFHGASAWTPNAQELAAAGVSDNESGWRALIDELRLRALIVTRGEHGATVVRADGSVRQIIAPRQTVVTSVAGAGDILAGVVTVKMGQGSSWDEAADEGVRAAATFVATDPLVVYNDPRRGGEE